MARWKKLQSVFAYLMRYGMQSRSEIRAMPWRTLVRLHAEISAIIGAENDGGGG